MVEDILKHILIQPQIPNEVEQRKNIHEENHHQCHSLVNRGLTMVVRGLTCQKEYPIHASSPHSHPFLNTSHFSFQKTPTFNSYLSLWSSSNPPGIVTVKSFFVLKVRGRDCLNHRNGHLNQFYFARAQKIFFNCLLSQPALLAKP